MKLVRKRQTKETETQYKSKQKQKQKNKNKIPMSILQSPDTKTNAVYNMLKETIQYKS